MFVRISQIDVSRVLPLYTDTRQQWDIVQIPATWAFLRKLDGLPFELEPAFVHSALFCGSSDFGRAFEHVRPRIHGILCVRSVDRWGSARGDQFTIRQSSRTRYAVGLRCVQADRPPALNADYSRSNGSGQPAATVSAYHQVWATMGAIGSKRRFSTADRHGADARRIFLGISLVRSNVSSIYSVVFTWHVRIVICSLLYISIQDKNINCYK